MTDLGKKQLMRVLTLLLSLIAFSSSSWALPLTFTLSPFDGGADTLLTASGESVATISSDTLRDNNLPFDFINDTFVLEDLGTLFFQGSVAGDLELYGIFGDDNGGPGVDQFALLFRNTYGINETITGTGSALTGLAYSHFISGGEADGVPVPFKIELVTSAVPEPSTLSLLGLGLAGLGWSRRRAAKSRIFLLCIV